MNVAMTSNITIKDTSSAVILVVDDNDINLAIVSDMLSKAYTVYTASSGQQSLAFCKKHRPDLVIMDVQMPGMSGLQVCKAMQMDEILRDIPVLFVTSLDHVEDEKACWDAGCVDFMLKPVTSVSLLNRVKTHLTLKFQNDFLTELSFLDGLTGLYNRRYFSDYLQRQWTLARRNKTTLCLLMIDIDFFKQFNDSYGHMEGDECLRQVARCLANTIQRPTDLIARYGGEEFICILPDTNIEGAGKLAEQMNVAVNKLQILNEASKFSHVTVSIGVASISDTMREVDKLIELADKRLYEAKQSGRNKWVAQ